MIVILLFSMVFHYLEKVEYKLSCIFVARVKQKDEILHYYQNDCDIVHVQYDIKALF